jgi:Tfp pilus assembly protein PilO
MPEAEQGLEPPTRRSKLVFLVVAGIVVVILGYFVLGMPGMDHTGDMTDMRMEPSS